jgi:4-amino-4-deoxy-L-arabinose transferase-like glycosyltransferase
MTGVQEHSYLWMPAAAFLQAPWFKLFGVGVLSDRAFSTAWGLIALLCWFAIIRTLSGRVELALLATALVAIDSAVIDAASDGRIEMLTVALGALAMASFLRLRERRLPLAILFSQTCVAIAFFVHPVGGAGLFAVLLLYVALDWRRFHWSHLLIAAIPYVIGVGLSAAYILQNPSDFQAQMTAVMHARESSRGSLLSGFISEVQQRLLGYYFPPYASGSGKIKIWLLVGYTLGLIGAFWQTPFRRTIGGKILLILPVLYFILLSVFEPAKQLYYMVYLTPGFAIALAIAIYWLWTERRVPRWLLGTVLAAFVLLQLSWTAATIRRDSYHQDFLPAVDFLRQHAKPASLAIGSGEFAFALGFHGGFLIDSSLGYTSGKRPDFVVVDERGFMEAFRGYQKRAPKIYEHITRLLASEYRQVYENRTYKIYAKTQMAP